MFISHHWGVQLRAISQRVPKLPFRITSLKIMLLKSLPFSQGSKSQNFFFFVLWKIKYTYYHFIIILPHWNMTKEVKIKDEIYCFFHSQYHGWCKPGGARSQGISGNDLYPVWIEQNGSHAEKVNSFSKKKNCVTPHCYLSSLEAVICIKFNFDWIYVSVRWKASENCNLHFHFCYQQVKY